MAGMRWRDRDGAGGMDAAVVVVVVVGPLSKKNMHMKKPFRGIL